MNAAIVARCQLISRKALSLADAADRNRSGNVVADGGRELAQLTNDLTDLTDQLGDDAWKKLWMTGPQPPF